MSNIKERGFASLLIVVILLIALAVGVYLATHQQLFKSRAANQPGGAGDKTCAVAIKQQSKSQNSVSYNKIDLDYSGSGGVLSIWLIKNGDGDPIKGTVLVGSKRRDPALTRQDNFHDRIVNQYGLWQQDCSSQSCSGTFNVTLPDDYANYTVHCQIRKDSEQPVNWCSGYPGCKYNGGPFPCGDPRAEDLIDKNNGYKQSCSTQDLISVSTIKPEAPSIQTATCSLAQSLGSESSLQVINFNITGRNLGTAQDIRSIKINGETVASQLLNWTDQAISGHGNEMEPKAIKNFIPIEVNVNDTPAFGQCQIGQDGPVVSSLTCQFRDGGVAADGSTQRNLAINLKGRGFGAEWQGSSGRAGSLQVGDNNLETEPVLWSDNEVSYVWLKVPAASQDNSYPVIIRTAAGNQTQTYCTVVNPVQ